jgi:Lrp/AsnC family leucine-responsive transcriptional regulator
MDPLDLKILGALQADNRRSAAELGEAVGLSVSAASDRVRRLNASGAVVANRAVLDPRKLGLNLCAFVFIDLEPRADEAAFAAALAPMAEVQEAHHVTGPHSWLLKIRTRDTDALQALLTTRIKTLPGVLRSETFVALAAAKETTELALETVS